MKKLKHILRFTIWQEEVKAKEENDETSGYEFELQREEEKYLDYQEQRKLAREKGDDPDNVKESYDAKHYEVCSQYVLYSFNNIRVIKRTSINKWSK